VTTSLTMVVRSTSILMSITVEPVVPEYLPTLVHCELVWRASGPSAAVPQGRQAQGGHVSVLLLAATTGGVCLPITAPMSDA
jgi:hypothetical protein